MEENERREGVRDERVEGFRVHVVGSGGGEEVAVDDPVGAPLREDRCSLELRAERGIDIAHHVHHSDEEVGDNDETQ